MFLFEQPYRILPCSTPFSLPLHRFPISAHPQTVRGPEHQPKDASISISMADHTFSDLDGLLDSSFSPFSPLFFCFCILFLPPPHLSFSLFAIFLIVFAGALDDFGKIDLGPPPPRQTPFSHSPYYYLFFLQKSLFVFLGLLILGSKNHVLVLFH